MRNLKILVIFLLVGFLINITGVKASENLVSNPGFEEDIDGDNIPDGWLISVQKGPAHLKRDSSVKKSGNYSVMIERKESDMEGQARYYQLVPVEAGKKYQVSLFYKLDEDFSGKADVMLNGCGINCRYWWLSKTASENAEGWKRLEFNFSPRKSGEITLLLQNRGTGTIWYDDISITTEAWVKDIDGVLVGGGGDSKMDHRIKNGGFEDGFEYWIKNAQPGNTNYNLSIDNTVFHSGKSSLKISIFEDTDNFKQVRVYQGIKVKKGQTYKLSRAYKLLNCIGISDIYLASKIKSSLKRVIGGTFLPNTFLDDNKWHIQEDLFTPTNDGEIGIYVALRDKGTIWYDNITVTEVNYSKTTNTPSIYLLPIEPYHGCFFKNSENRDYKIKIYISPDNIDFNEYSGIIMVNYLYRSVMTRRYKQVFYNNVETIKKEMDFNIDCKELKPGEYELSFILTDKNQEKIISYKEIQLFVTDKILPSKNKRKNLSVNNKDIFIIDGYDLKNIRTKPWNTFEDVKNAGFNVCHNYNFEGAASSNSINNEIKGYIEGAQNAGLYVRLGMPRKDFNYKAIKERILRFKDYPSIIGYYEDEQLYRNAPLENFLLWYTLSKALDPTRYVIMEDKMKDFEDGWEPKYDVAFYMDYCFPDKMGISQDISNLFYRLSMAEDKPVVPAIQAFVQGGESYYPTYEDHRASCYHNIINGAKGISFFSLLYQTEERWEQLKRITKELEEMSPVFLAPFDEETQCTIDADTDLPHPIEWCIKKYKGTYYLLMVNRFYKEIDTVIKFNRKVGKVTDMDKGHEIAVKDNNISITFKPIEVKRILISYHSNK
ncbi:carbohydrate binding domain-containing protein [bacterium]|nr:carbohydrate binding domain-containing protein [bacterium]